jgi:hypothetical protein
MNSSEKTRGTMVSLTYDKHRKFFRVLEVTNLRKTAGCDGLEVLRMFSLKKIILPSSPQEDYKLPGQILWSKLFKASVTFGSAF